MWKKKIQPQEKRMQTPVANFMVKNKQNGENWQQQQKIVLKKKKQQKS